MDSKVAFHWMICGQGNTPNYFNLLSDRLAKSVGGRFDNYIPGKH